VSEVQGVHDRLAHIGIGVAGKTAEPGPHGVQGLAYGNEAAAVDNTFDGEQLVVGLLGISVANHDRGGQIAEGHVIGAQLLERVIGVPCLVVGIRIDQRRLPVEHHLAQRGADRLALGEPLAPQACEILDRLALVEGNPARGPAVGEAQIVERVEQARRGRIGKAQHGQHAQVSIPELRLDTAEQCHVAQDGIEMGRDGRHGDIPKNEERAVAFQGRDRC
jgi:hypothetical protein